MWIFGKGNHHFRTYYLVFLKPYRACLIILFLKSWTIFILGRHCCLFCLITQSELKIPLHQRGKSLKRTLEGLDTDLKRFIEEFGGDLKKAKFCNNVIEERMINIPLDQVNNVDNILSFSRICQFKHLSTLEQMLHFYIQIWK